jgi:hypothetical protein
VLAVILPAARLCSFFANLLRGYNAWMLRFGIMVAAAGLASGQTVLTRVSERPEILHEDNSRRFGPIWNGNVLIGIEKNGSSAPIVWTLDRSSTLEEIHFSIPEADYIGVSRLAGSADGAIAVAGGAIGNDGTRFGFIGIVPPSRGNSMVVRTDSYSPDLVTIASDGVIWAIGQQVDGKKVINNVLKRFSRSGKLLTSEALKVGADPFKPSSLRSSRDRVGWLKGGSEYLEFSLDGTIASRFPGPPLGADDYPMFDLALGDDFGVIANATYGRKIWTLDRLRRVWNPVQVSGEPVGLVYGFEGDQLVVGAWSKDRGFLLVHCRIDSH